MNPFFSSDPAMRAAMLPQTKTPPTASAFSARFPASAP